MRKLGYKPGESVMVLRSPNWFISELKTGATKPVTASRATWLHGFFYSRAEVEHFLATMSLEDIGKAIWVSWPKS